MKENFQIEDKRTGVKYWISRAMAVTVVIIAVKKSWFGLRKKYYILAERRGPGCPDYVGHYVHPCGYLSWSETLREAGVRESYEELGIELREEDLRFVGINDSVSANRQNVTVRFAVFLDYDRVKSDLDSGLINTNSRSRGGEADEVDDLALIAEDDISKYRWAFGHDQLAKDVIDGRTSITT